MNIEPYICIGNHDIVGTGPFASNPVAKWVESLYGSLIYTRQLPGTCVYVSSLSICPTAETIAILAARLDAIEQRDLVARHILFWHYNMEAELSDWWTDEIKCQTRLTLLRRKSILCVCTGHLHETQLYTHSFGPTGDMTTGINPADYHIPFIGAGGSEFIIVRIDIGLNGSYHITAQGHNGNRYTDTYLEWSK